MEDDNTLGMPPLAPLATEAEEADPTPPRRRRRREVPAPDSIHDASEEDEKIARLLEDDENSGAQIEISRKTTNNKWALCCVFPLSDWSSDSKVQVANQFGGGTYRATVRRSDKSFASTFFFEVDPAVKVRAATEAAPPFDMQALVAQLKPAQSDSNGFVQMMQAQQAMMMQFMQMQAAQSSENMKALASVIARPVTPSAPMNDRIVEVLLAKALDKPAAMDLPKIIEAVAKLRTVANGGDAGGDDDDEEGGGNSDIFGAVLKSLPALVGMIGGANRVPAIANNPPQPQPQPQPRPRPAPRPAPQQVTPQPAPQPAPAPAPVEQVAPKDYSLLQLFLPQIVGMAEAKQTPTDVAKIIEDTLDGQQLADLKDLLRTDTWFQTLVDLHRPVMTWPRWFARLRENLIGTASTQVIEAETVPAT